jgi:hypothetical protein
VYTIDPGQRLRHLQAEKAATVPGDDRWRRVSTARHTVKGMYNDIDERLC